MRQNFCNKKFLNHQVLLILNNLHQHCYQTHFNTIFYLAARKMRTEIKNHVFRRRKIDYKINFKVKIKHSGERENEKLFSFHNILLMLFFLVEKQWKLQIFESFIASSHFRFFTNGFSCIKFPSILSDFTVKMNKEKRILQGSKGCKKFFNDDKF